MYSFSKTERICSKLTIEKLFAGGNRSTAVYPLRAVYMTEEGKDGVPASILISVPKRRFRHAVDRNRMKRQVREAYRLNKHMLWEVLQSQGLSASIAFVCIADDLCSSVQVERSVKKILHRIAEQIQKGL